MDPMGAFLEEEWESLNKMFSCEDSDSFWRHLEVASLFSDDQNVPGVDQSLFHASSSINTNFNCVSQESSQGCETDTSLFTNHANGVNFPQETGTDSFESMIFYTMDENNNNGSMNVPVFTDEAMEEILQLKAQLCDDQMRNVGIQPNQNGGSYNVAQLKRKYEAPETQSQDQSDDKSSESPKKKSRAPRNAPKNKRNVQPRKKKAKEISNNEEESNGATSSEIDSNASQELIEGSTSESKDCVNTSGKARAGRGSATDPQSLYARKRRERINERLRILQNLVPNGTKVDISTMLEEAVQYVKFLQLQIKLLSSDDTWMYAPIAYNGMDMGLYQRMILPNLLPQN